MRMAIDGGPATKLCDAEFGLGLSWGSDGWIYFLVVDQRDRRRYGRMAAERHLGDGGEVTDRDGAAVRMTDQVNGALRGRQALIERGDLAIQAVWFGIAPAQQ